MIIMIMINDKNYSDKKNNNCKYNNNKIGLQLSKKTSKNGKKFFSFRGLQAWNALLVETKKTSSLQEFKTKKPILYFLI